MRIAIMGTGGIGGYCGAKLATKGADILFIARGEHLKAMQRSGLRLLSALGNVTLEEVNATDNPAGRELTDFVLFTVKGPDTDRAIELIAPIVGPQGRSVFSNIGCALCHTPQMQTAPVMNSLVLQNRPVNLFSDLLVHHMGAGLADDIIQGAAGPDEFRTTPLWGVGQRLFFLHDGRTSDLLDAINEHFSQPTDTYPASEANAVINNFQSLSKNDKQAILDFLRSL